MKRQRRLSPLEIETIVRAYTDRTSMTALAVELGVRWSTVSAILARAGVIPRQQRVLDPALVNRAVRLYEQGWSLARIGNALDFNAGTIRTHLKRRGVQMRLARGLLFRDLDQGHS